MTKAILLLMGWLVTFAPDLPLTVSGLVTGSKSHVTLTNTSKQPVTAWSLATIVPQDGKIRREIETVDGYLSEVTQGIPGSSERLERLMPGQARQIELDPLPANATVEILAVVFDDGTAMGDPELIKSIFARRTAERDGLQNVVDAFNEVLGTLHGEPALDALRDRLSAFAARAESTPVRAALDAVQTFRGQGAAPEAIDQQLRSYAAFVERQLQLANKHAGPKSG